MSNWKVFAEDAGTGLQDQSDHDFGDGANFGAHVHSPNDTDYAPVAPTLSADYSVPEVTLGEAQYKIKATNVSGRERDGVQTTWPEVTFVVKAPSTTLSLSDGAVNHIYVSVDLTTTGDDATYVVNTTGSAPSGPSLKVAEVDTSADTSDVFNQNPDGEFNSVKTGRADIDSYSVDLDKTTDQSLSANTDTTVNWDDQDVDTDIYTYDTSQDTIDVAAAGDYRVTGTIRIDGASDQDVSQVRIFINGSRDKTPDWRASGSISAGSFSALLKDLSAGDTIRIDVRVQSGGTLIGNNSVFASISKEA